MHFSLEVKWCVMSHSALHRYYLSFIRPLLEYGDVIFDNCSQNDKNTLESIQYNALRLITGCKKGTSRQETGLCTLQTRRTFHKILQFHSIVFKTCPDNLQTFLTRPLRKSRNITRARGVVQILRTSLQNIILSLFLSPFKHTFTVTVQHTLLFPKSSI